MTTAATIPFLKALTAFLLTIQGASLAPSAAQNAVNIAENGVQLAAQAIAAQQIPFTVPQNDGVWPNIKDLGNAAYRDGNGGWARLGPSVSLLEQYTSFGDLNHDGSDDAAVILAKPAEANTTAATTSANNPGEHYFLAAMLNQGGTMFEVAELPLGNTLSIVSHSIASGTIIIDGKQYKLFGINLSEE
jgi:hypothetical protein